MLYSVFKVVSESSTNSVEHNGLRRTDVSISVIEEWTSMKTAIEIEQ